jgi:hypothetical protein
MVHGAAATGIAGTQDPVTSAGFGARSSLSWLPCSARRPGQDESRLPGPAVPFAERAMSGMGVECGLRRSIHVHKVPQFRTLGNREGHGVHVSLGRQRGAGHMPGGRTLGIRRPGAKRLQPLRGQEPRSGSQFRGPTTPWPLARRMRCTPTWVQTSLPSGPATALRRRLMARRLRPGTSRRVGTVTSRVHVHNDEDFRRRSDLPLELAVPTKQRRPHGKPGPPDCLAVKKRRDLRAPYRRRARPLDPHDPRDQRLASVHGHDSLSLGRRSNRTPGPVPSPTTGATASRG